MPWTTSDKVMDIRRRSAVVDVIVETLDGWRRHITGRNASVLAFFTFLSIFPLMLAATTILGFVLEDNEDLQQRIIDGALNDIPVIGQQLAEDPASLDGNIWALIIGLGGALWSASRAFVGLQGALDDTWEVSVDHRASMPVQRGRALVGMLILGGAQVGSIAIATVVRAIDLPAGADVLLILATLVVHVAAVAAMYRYLTSADPGWGDVWPGAIIAGAVYSLLQQIGVWLVDEIQNNASDTYGNFAIVLGLITWLSIIAIATLMSAELNAALVRHREGSLDRIVPPEKRAAQQTVTQANADRPGMTPATATTAAESGDGQPAAASTSSTT